MISLPPQQQHLPPTFDVSFKPSLEKINTILPSISMTGELFNASLIETGYGYADRRFDHPRMAIFTELEAQARRELRGLWKEITKDRMPAWRRRLEE